jgi:hypothetical protein
VLRIRARPHRNDHHHRERGTGGTGVRDEVCGIERDKDERQPGLAHDFGRFGISVAAGSESVNMRCARCERRAGAGISYMLYSA